jgi:hypothetical protein
MEIRLNDSNWREGGYISATGRKGMKTASWVDGWFWPESGASPDSYFSTI